MTSVAAEIAELEQLLAELEAAEATRAARQDTFAILGYHPTERQAEFHDATEWDVLYGGAAGGGKTRALLMEGVRDCVRYPGFVALAVRESYPMLAESFLVELAKVDYCRALGAVYNKTSHDLNFVNGSQFRFRYCDSLEDAKNRLGSEIQKLLVDEATRQQPAAIDFLASRLRTSNPAIPVLGIRLGSNPGGIGHGFCKRRYIDPGPVYEETVDDRPTGHLIRFISAKHTDNPYLVDYESTLDGIKDPQMRAAYRDGSWDVFPGQKFGEWRRERHIVPAFPIPNSWRRGCGIDWGYAAAWAVEWVALDEDKRAWVYGELYDTEVGEADQARRILAAEAARNENPPGQRHADPSMWARRGDAHPIAAVYGMQGCHLIKAENNRVIGWQRVHSYLADGPACRYHRDLGWKTCPMLHVLDGKAPNLVRTLPDLPTDKTNPEDVDGDSENHSADALRYRLMALPIPPRSKPPAPGTPGGPPLPSTYQRVQKQLLSGRRSGRSHPTLGRI